MIFKYIKNNKWDDVFEFINNNNITDLNIHDGKYNYIITYSILHNNFNVFKKLIDLGAKINVIDFHNRSLLYYIIFYDLDNFFDYITNKTNIDNSIIHIIDSDGNIPLHYAIKYKHINFIKKLVDLESDLIMSSNDGFNAVNYAILSKNLDICKLLIDKVTDINHINKNGDGYLHVAVYTQQIEICKLLIKRGIDINQINSIHHFVPLVYSIHVKDLNIFNLLLEYNVNINAVDIYGNTPIYYIIDNKTVEMFDIISKYKLNYNNINVENKTVLHYILDSDYTRYEITKFLKSTNLNIQDIDNNSCLHKLTQLNIWKKYINILSTKKLNINLKNNNNKLPIDYVQSSDMDLFINMLSNSYMYTLKHNPSIVWFNEWENICKMNELSKNDKKILKKYTSHNDDQCFHIIKDNIKNNISYPMRDKKKIDFKSIKKSNKTCIYTGTIIDVLIGLLYLNIQYNSVCSPLNTGFININNYNKYKTKLNQIEELGASNISLNINDIFDIKILWENSNVTYPNNFSENIINCSKRYYIIPISIHLPNVYHANYLLYDKKFNEIERFEPHGSGQLLDFDYNFTYLDEILSNYFNKINITYIKPIDFLPNVGLQILESYEYKNKKVGDPGGFCAVWNVWWIHMRLSHPKIPRNKLIKKFIKTIKQHNISFRNYIRDFSSVISTTRDNILSKSNIDINDFINEKYSSSDLESIINNINNIIQL